MTRGGRRGTRAAIALVVAAFTLAGCADEEPPPRTSQPEAPLATAPAATITTPVAPPSVPPAGDCPNQADAAVNPLNRIAGPLIGDVTGDATPDRVYLSLDEAAPPGCQAFVVVSETVSLVAPIEGWDPSGGLTSPRFEGLHQIDGRPGAEIVVHLAAGASTQFVGAFSATGGVIERLATTATEQSSSGSNDLFAFGGSVGHLEAVDCTEDGRIVVSSAIPRGERYEVTRSFYAPAGATLEPSTPGTRRAVVALDQIEDFPEFAASPFGTCPPA